MLGSAGSASALKLQPGWILGFHSEPSNGCPGLDWHIVAGANNQLKGMISWDDMHHVVRVSGSADQDGRFHLVFPPMKGSPAEGALWDRFRITMDGWRLMSWAPNALIRTSGLNGSGSPGPALKADKQLQPSLQLADAALGTKAPLAASLLNPCSPMPYSLHGPVRHHTEAQAVFCRAHQADRYARSHRTVRN